MDYKQLLWAIKEFPLLANHTRNGMITEIEKSKTLFGVPLEDDKQKWISVEERLPEENNWYRVLKETPANKSIKDIAFFEDGCWVTDKVHNSCIYGTVTHWAPIEFPEE